MNPVGHMHWPWWFRVLIWIDQGVNVIFLNGDPDETISSRIGRRKKAGKLTWRHPLSMVVYRLLEWIDPGHCERSIELWTSL